MKHGGGQKTRPVKEMTETFKENMQEIKLHEMHVQQKEKLLQILQKDFKSPDSEVREVKSPVANPLKAASEAELWDKLKAFGRDRDMPEEGITNEIIKTLHKPKILSENPKIFEIPYNPEPWKAIHFNSEEARELLKSASKDSEETTPLLDENLKFEHDVLVKKFGFFPLEDETEAPEEDEDQEEVSEREMDFSATERVILDYQTGVLYLAIGSVVVFFAVALCYSLKHMRKWGSRNYTEGKKINDTKRDRMKSRYIASVNKTPGITLKESLVRGTPKGSGYLPSLFYTFLLLGTGTVSDL